MSPYRDSANPSYLRERRRYQLAKEILLLTLHYTGMSYAERAEESVKRADALLDALEKTR